MDRHSASGDEDARLSSTSLPPGVISEVERSPHYSASGSSLEDEKPMLGTSPTRSSNGRNGSEASLRPFSELALARAEHVRHGMDFTQDDGALHYTEDAASPMWGAQPSASYDVDLAMGLPAVPDHDGDPAQVSAEDAGYLSDSQLHIARHLSPVKEAYYMPQLDRLPARKRAGPALRNALAHQGTIAPGQPGRVRRVKDKDKVLTLQLRDQGSDESSMHSAAAAHVNVTAYCIAFELDLAALEADLQERFGLEHVHAYPQDLKASQTADIVHARFVDDTGNVAGDVFYFEFGVAVTWNLSSGQEAEAVWQLAGKHMLQRLPEAAIEVDELTVECGPAAGPTMIKDDTIFMSRRVYEGVLVRVAASLALAQSTRISAQETQVMEMVESTRSLPFQLVRHGSVTLPHGELAILIGKVFLQKSALNLQVLSGHKETPKLFWGKPDNLQVIYHAVSEYLDLDERADILNRRFTALTDMLDLLRDQQSTRHSEHLEWIVIGLIVASAGLGMLQIASLIRSEWVRHGTHPAIEYVAAVWDALAHGSRFLI